MSVNRGQPQSADGDLWGKRSSPRPERPTITERVTQGCPRLGQDCLAVGGHMTLVVGGVAFLDLVHVLSGTLV